SIYAIDTKLATEIRSKIEIITNKLVLDCQEVVCRAIDIGDMLDQLFRNLQGGNESFKKDFSTQTDL
uniref:Uncharacterized protein n=1 Tax=Romanomermis culicivorax TaxID=13658 RepID=A0A915KPE7_ROMCU